MKKKLISLFSALMVLFMIATAGCDNGALTGADQEMSLDEVKGRILDACMAEDCGGINDTVAGKGASATSLPLVLAHPVGKKSDGGLVYSFEIRWESYFTTYGMYAPESRTSPEVFEEGFNEKGTFSKFLRTVVLNTNTLDWVNVSFTIRDNNAGFVTFSFYGNNGRIETVLPNTQMQYRATYASFISYGEVGEGNIGILADFDVNPNNFSYRAIVPYSTIAEAFDLQINEDIVIEGRLLMVFDDGNPVTEVGSVDEYHTQHLNQIDGVGVSNTSFNQIRLDGYKSVQGVRMGWGESRRLCHSMSVVSSEGFTSTVFLPGDCGSSDGKG